jgi:drug/metabolite transporter (DMT)-like permease
VSIVAPLTAAYPVLVVLWGVWHGLSPTALQWSAIALTILGAIVVGRSGHEDGGISAVKPENRVVFFTACGLSMLGYAGSVVLAQNAAVAMGGIEAAFVSRPTALLILAPFALKEKHTGFLTRNLWLGVLAMGALDVMGLIAIAVSGHFPMKEFAAVGVSTYGATAVLLATLVLREKVAPGQWIGIAMIVAGVAALSITQA